jgi:hypothetical protein
MTPKELRNIILQLILVILVGVWVALTYDNCDEPHTKSNIPPKPLYNGPQIYDFDDEEWKPLFYEPNVNEPDKRKYIEYKDLDKYLMENVDGYLEDTYWGQEYDLDY